MNAHIRSTSRHSTEWCDADVSEIKCLECQYHYQTNEIYASTISWEKINHCRNG